jgi:prepilin signal peptidase PulO-like enzyme (type II secretory pathway)
MTSSVLPFIIMVTVLIYAVLTILVIYLLKKTKIKRQYIGAIICFFLILTVITIFLDPRYLYASLILFLFTISIIIINWFEKIIQHREGAVKSLKNSGSSGTLQLLE